MQLHFSLLLRHDGYHDAAWRHEDVEPTRATDIGRFVDLAKEAERGLFDALFMGDSVALASHPWKYLYGFEPLTLLSALAMTTSNIGLIGSVSTTYSEPFNVARQLASLDYVSRGRAGWNIVTTQSLDASENFGAETAPSHADRYRRADEFFQVVSDLWDSWEDDAVVADKAAGLFVDPKKVHPIDHKGERFSVKGPLNIARPPQGHPFIVQAGSSDVGMDFGARVADAMFTSQHDFNDAQRFYKSMKRLASEHGRDPDTIKILPGLVPILGSTEGEAKRVQNELFELADTGKAFESLSARLEIDLSAYPYDGLVPIDDLPPADHIEGARSRFQIIVDLCKRNRFTIRDLVRWYTSGTHRNFVGTPEQLADDIEHWVGSGAADGFNLLPSVNANGLSIFVDQVVPELQRRGHFRREYNSTTLRGHFGLSPRVERPKKD